MTLQSGRIITLEALEQQRAYAGLQVGRPIVMMNNGIIERTLRIAKDSCFGDSSPHLIAPPRRDYCQTPGDAIDDREDRKQLAWLQMEHPEYTFEWMPEIVCIGSFHSFGGVRDHVDDLTYLTVVWFQDEYAPPILEPALEQLLALDWDSLAAVGDL